MRVALIGSNGLLGDQLGLLCAARGDELTVWGRRKPERHPFNHFVATDFLKDEIDIEELARYDAIFYVAVAGTQTHLRQGWDMMYKLNTWLPIRLAKGLEERQYKGVLVTFGSCFEIGANAEEHLFTEEEVAASERPVPNDYCRSKRLLTRFVRSNNAPFRHLHLVLPVIYGSDECEQRLIPYTLGMIARGERPQFTAGTQVRHYLYVGDAARVVMELVDAKETGLFNIAGAERFTVREVVQTLYDAKGIPMPDGLFGTEQRQDAAMQNLLLDGSKLNNALQLPPPINKFKVVLQQYEVI